MMSRTTLTMLTAGALCALSLSVAALRHYALGEETHVPRGPGNYKVTLLVRGRALANAKLVTACPLDFGRQHIFGEETSSKELTAKVVDADRGERRQVQWTGTNAGPIEARYTFQCTVDVRHPTAPMARLHQRLHAPPPPGEHLHAAPGIDPSHAEITATALGLAAVLEAPMDKARELYRFVTETIANEPATGWRMTAAACLEQGRGDALAQSRLLVALLRNRGIPARLVHGLLLQKHAELAVHTWVEAWCDNHWISMCPFYRQCGRVPANYLVLGYDDFVPVRGSKMENLRHAFLVERQDAGDTPTDQSPLKSFFQQISLYSLPPAESELVEMLLLLPLAALIICIFRNLIGLSTFGTFAPGLIGLAFRQYESLPGAVFFVLILLTGWGLRRALDRFHLLQVPRTSFMLSLVVVVLVSAILAANYLDVAATRFISLFPMIILTGMIERFWTLETEDGAWASFRTLLNTMFIAGVIGLTLSLPGLAGSLFAHPELLGICMALQLVIGRYTGYRLTELFRFRDLLDEELQRVQPEPRPLGSD